ncbi:MAG: permease-like cell division protein FtsX [Bacteroidia bacterium]|nr:cell division protein FtsX [Bacteroidota bacterium]MBP7245564.1 permease-like cell division protein FtsX [Bacteroidia bacterium]
MSLVLFLLGSLGVLLLQANQVSNYVKENIGISLIINPDADSTQINDILTRLSTTQYIKSFQLISKEEAAETLKKDLGEDFITFLGHNPLYPSIDIRLKAEFADEKTVASFLSSIQQHPSINEVQYQPSLIESVNRNLKTITWILIIFSSLLIIVSITLINNTIRISLYARRLLIKSMLLVGATKGFILKPFLIKSVFNGFMGGLIAVFLLAGLLYGISVKLPEISLIQDVRILGYVAAGMVVTGIILSFVSTWFAVNKYLRYRTDNIY